MTEPSSGVPGEIANAETEPSQQQPDQPEKVELDVDEEKMAAWDDVKDNYIDPPSDENDVEETFSAGDPNPPDPDQTTDGAASAEPAPTDKADETDEADDSATS